MITPVEFMNYYYKEGKLDEYKVISLKLNEFQTLYKNFITHTKSDKPRQATRETLALFCETHPIEDLMETITKIEQSGYLELIFQIYKVFLKCESEKRKVVWFYGAPNAGKSCVSSLLGKIFYCQELLFTEGKYTISSNQHPFATQIAILDEANFYDMFKPSNVANMKRFFEGRGFVTRSMYNQPVVDFVGSFVFVTSNGLPALSRDEDHKYDWEAIRVRSALIETHKSFTDKGKDAFPFNEIHLAHYLHYLLHKYEDVPSPDSLKPFELP